MRYADHVSRQSFGGASPGAHLPRSDTMCRGLRTVRAQTRSSKREAAARVIEQMPEWATVIGDAAPLPAVTRNSRFDDEPTRDAPRPHRAHSPQVARASSAAGSARIRRGSGWKSLPEARRSERPEEPRSAGGRHPSKPWCLLRSDRGPSGQEKHTGRGWACARGLIHEFSGSPEVVHDSSPNAIMETGPRRGPQPGRLVGWRPRR